MNRQYQDSSSACCCGRSDHSSRYRINPQFSRDSSSEDEKECRNYELTRHNNFYKNNQPKCNFKTLDDQSWNDNTFSTLREDSCRYAKSEIERATAADSSCSQDPCRSKNSCGNASLLRKANNLINYAPESEFLKKIKRQCQYLDNSQPNIYFSTDDFIDSDDSPYECPKCEVSSDPVSRQRDQCSRDKVRSASEKSSKCTCNQQSNVTRVNDDHVYNKNVAKVQRLCEEFMAEKQSRERKPADESQCFKKKSEHISRSKKPGHCCEKRKRLSISSEKCDLSNQFEPTLKKPLENSCERCWRFASPSRSPVNKPDQKFDPNFRRGHSCTDLEKGDGDVVDRDSQFESVKSVMFDEKERSPTPICCRQHKFNVVRSPPISVMRGQDSFFLPSGCAPTRVKEPLNEQSFRKPLENYFLNSQTNKCGLSERDRVSPCDSMRKCRPRSCSPGLSSPETGKCPNFGARDLKSTCLNPWKNCCENFNPCQNVKKPECERPKTSKGSSTGFAKGGSPSKSFDPSNLKPIPEGRLESSHEDKSDSSNGRKTSKSVDETLKNESLKNESWKNETSKNETLKNETSKNETSKNEISKNEISKNVVLKTQSRITMKASNSKKVNSSASKSKSNQKSPSPKAKSVRLKSTKPTKGMKKFTQIDKSQTNLEKYKCPQDIIENVCPDKEEFEPKMSPVAKGCHYNYKPSSSHPIRECCCYPRIVKSKNESSSPSNYAFCCHCDWGKHQNNQTCGGQSFRSSPGVSPIYEDKIRAYPGPNVDSNERHFMKTSDLKSCTCDSTLKTSFAENSSGQSSRDFSGRTLSCPYRDFTNKFGSKLCNSPESNGTQTWDDCQPTKKSPKACEQFLGCTPRKYFVFYMTQSKEPKKGDDVEVLVEEFGKTSENEKDARTKDIAEKMKKISECPSDSMALRFQKGVNETCKTPPSSRILYF